MNEDGYRDFHTIAWCRNCNNTGRVKVVIGKNWRDGRVYDFTVPKPCDGCDPETGYVNIFCQMSCYCEDGKHAGFLT